MTDIKTNDLHTAIVIGLNAVQYLTMRVAHSGRTFEFTECHASGEMSETSRKLRLDHENILRETLEGIDVLMNLLGDFENGQDGVSDEDEQVTDYAFEHVGEVLSYRTKGQTP